MGGAATTYPYAGYSIFILHAYGSPTQLADHQTSNTWSCPQTAISPTDALEFIIYVYDGANWNTAATFITNQLGAGQLDSVTWTFNFQSCVDYHLTDGYDWNEGGTWSFRWGDILPSGSGNYSPQISGVSYTPAHSVTVTSSPTGSGFITVDSTSYSSPHTFTWAEGSSHTIAASSTVSGGSGIQYTFSSE